MPRSFAASTRPWPARIVFALSIRMGLVKPKLRIDSAICFTCLREWVRAFFAQGRNWPTGSVSILRSAMAQFLSNGIR